MKRTPIAALAVAVKTALPLTALAVVLAFAVPSLAGEENGEPYDSRSAGHPLRIAAYALHPVGVILDRLIFRPAWWIGGFEPIRTLVGREPALPHFTPAPDPAPEPAPEPGTSPSNP